MNRHDELNDVLRILADAGPREAPARVEMEVIRAFRRDRRTRRFRGGFAMMTVTGAVAAALAVVAVIPNPAAPPDVVVSRTPPPAMAWIAPQPVTPAPKQLAVRSHRPQKAPASDLLAVSGFVPLSYGDDALVTESARIVRVVLPRSALRMAGFSVAQERAADPVQADVLLGADGLAHAVRVVNE